MEFWNQPGRWRTSVPEHARRDGLWQVRLTVEGSTWLWQYNRARGIPKGPPGVTPAAQDAEQVAWERWIDAKVAWDRHQAAVTARDANRVFGIAGPDPGPPPPFPGSAPAALVALVGNPPPFAAARVPMQHDVDFGDGFTRRYVDHVAMRPRFAFYRFDAGVMDVGERVRDMPPADLDPIYAAAGIGPSTQRVMQAVSPLEGGFDSINTYDTGLVSVGFIQFAALRDGAGSLGEVLWRQKTANPSSFQSDFRRFGVDVNAAGSLVVIDPSTGSELVGGEAARMIIHDKRLTAVFHRAGEQSLPFRVAQLQIAHEQYYPAGDLITIEVGDRVLSARVSEIFPSEAARATLMDRKVNTGRLFPLEDVLTQLVQDRGLRTLQEAAAFELELVQRMRFRHDFTVDATLSQPRGTGGQPARGGTRPPAR
jgi:hypothetical protein